MKNHYLAIWKSSDGKAYAPSVQLYESEAEARDDLGGLFVRLLTELPVSLPSLQVQESPRPARPAPVAGRIHPAKPRR